MGGWFAISSLSSKQVFRRRIENGTALFSLWLLFAWILLSYLPYMAPRYYLLTAIPLAVCTAFQIAEWRAGTAPALTSLRGLRGRGIAFGWLVFLCFTIVDASNHWISFTSERIYPVSPQRANQFLDLTERWSNAVEPFEGSCVVAYLSGALAFFILMMRTRRAPQPPIAWTRLATLCLAAVVALDLLQYADWIRHKDYALEEAKESFDAVVGPDAVVSGTFASALVLGTKRVDVPFVGYPRAGYLEEQGATHLVLGEPGDISGLERSLPDMVRRLVTVRSWPLRTRHLRKSTVFRIEWPDTMAMAQRYQPTPFESAVELIEAERYDEAFAALESLRRAQEIPDVHSLEAECFMHQGDMAGARASLEKA
ncbi:MAG TPA: hypothetical protein VFR10_13285, partial [bacterium]|nr:hypothetical protein [bacterium]